MSNWTPQQTSAIEAARAGESVACDAVAGAGKTTTLVAQAEAVSEHRGGSGLACAFAKRNQLDLAERMPKEVESRTMNSLGHGAWGKQINKRLTLKAEYGGKAKTYDAMNKLGIELDEFPDVGRLIGLAKANLLIPPKAIGGMKESPSEIWESIIEDNDLDIGIYSLDKSIEVAQNILRLTIEAGWNGVIDFDDQLYLPVIFKAQFRKYDFVIIDEYQDLSLCQHKIAEMVSHDTTQHLLAGDSRQAIYAFRGALTESASLLAKQLKCNPYPLTVSFRCPKAVVNEAKLLVPEIESADSAIQGNVDYAKRILAKHGDVILCRNTKPLIPMFYSLLRQGLPARILGSEIGKGLATILKRIYKEHGNLSYKALEPMIHLWLDAEITKYKAKGKEEKVEAKQHQGEALLTISSRAGDLISAIQSIENMFSDKVAPITLSTIHKAKGLEWQRVWFLDPGLIPSRFATTPEQQQQERNLKYVGITRAQRELYYVDSESHFAQEI